LIQLIELNISRKLPFTGHWQQSTPSHFFMVANNIKPH